MSRKTPTNSHPGIPDGQFELLKAMLNPEFVPNLFRGLGINPDDSDAKREDTPLEQQELVRNMLKSTLAPRMVESSGTRDDGPPNGSGSKEPMSRTTSSAATSETRHASQSRGPPRTSNSKEEPETVKSINERLRRTGVCGPGYDDKPENRALHLPLENLDKCSKCKKKGEKLLVCGNCGDKAYCGAECQKKDWLEHKPKCGEHDRVNLASFYPLLATIMDTHRLHELRPHHRALTHKIVSAPDFRDSADGIREFPDGSGVLGRIITLGDPIHLDTALAHPEEWWPSASDEDTRDLLTQRIISEGFILPSILGTLVTLMSAMYATTYTSAKGKGKGTERKRQIRLKYYGSPISDFGIVKGSVNIDARHRMGYLIPSEPLFIKGQDPDDHYWIYFTTAAGRDIYLDCGLYAFHKGRVLEAQPYSKHGMAPLTWCPTYFVDLMSSSGKNKLEALPSVEHTERERFSVLRDPSLEEVARHCPTNLNPEHVEAIVGFLNKVSSSTRKRSYLEQKMAVTWSIGSFFIMQLNLENREYLNFPDEPALHDLGYMDSGEAMGGVFREQAELYSKHMRKWEKKQRKGNKEVTLETMEAAYQEWAKKMYKEHYGEEATWTTREEAIQAWMGKSFNTR